MGKNFYFLTAWEKIVGLKDRFGQNGALIKQDDVSKTNKGYPQAGSDEYPGKNQLTFQLGG